MAKANPLKDKAILDHINSGRIVCKKDGTIIKDGKSVGFMHNKGYIAIEIKQPKRYLVMAHRVVWIYFNGPIPDNLNPNHIDGVKTNNRLKNLELLTEQDNIKHAIATGLNNTAILAKGVGNSQSNLTIKQIEIIRKFYGKKSRRTGKKFTARYLGKLFSVSHPTILSIVNNKRYL